MGPAPLDSLLYWRALVRGPDGSPYVDGVFVLDIIMPLDYPYTPPRMVCRTPIQHPQVRPHDGEVMLDILALDESRSWTPAMSLPKLVLSFVSLLAEPDLDENHICDDVCREMARSPRFTELATAHTKQHASTPAGAPLGPVWRRDPAFPLAFVRPDGSVVHVTI